MNITRLNTIGEKVIVKGGGSSGGGKSTIKYFDCLFDERDKYGEVNHGWFKVDNVKAIYTDDSDKDQIMIMPEAYEKVIAVAIDTSKRIYFNGQWVDIKEYLLDAEGFDMDAHPEITEEEFYYIPKEETWDCSTQEGLKDAFEKLWALVERYGEEHINSKTLPLIPWYNPLKFVGNSIFDGVDSSAIVGVRRGDTAVEDYTYIVFNPYSEYALKKYTSKEDGSVRYECGFIE